MFKNKRLLSIDFVPFLVGSLVILLSFKVGGPLNIELEEHSSSSNEFKSIFNGKDLTGWDGDSRFWHVENGILVGETSADNATEANTFLIREKYEPADS